MSTDATLKHLRFSSDFAVVADAVTDWQAPSPIDGWAARDVVTHLLTWLPPLLQEATGIHLTPTQLEADPAIQWRSRAAGIQAILDDPDTASAPVDDPRFTGMTVEAFIDRLYSNDVFMHTWDLAKASGQRPSLDRDVAQDLLNGLRSMDQEMLRSGGQYGPAQQTDSPDSVDQLMAFIGRNPAWQPAGR